HASCRQLPTFPTRRSSDLGVADARLWTAGHRSAAAKSSNPTRIFPAKSEEVAAADPAPANLHRSTLAQPGVAIADFKSLVCRQRDRKSTRLNSSHLVISYA